MTEEQQKPQRKWYQKKRFIIPLVIFGLFILGGILNSGNPQTTQTTTAQVDSDSQQESQNQEETNPSGKEIYQEVIAAERQARQEACGWGAPPERGEDETDEEYLQRIKCGAQESDDAGQAVLDKHGISEDEWGSILVDAMTENWPKE